MSKSQMNNKITRRMRNAIHFITLRGPSLLVIVQRVACFFFTKNSKYSRCVKKGLLRIFQDIFLEFLVSATLSLDYDFITVKGVRGTCTYSL